MKYLQRATSAFLVAAILLSSVAPACAVQKQVDDKLVEDMTDANFAQVLSNSKVPVLIDIYATWCMPCRKMAPNIDAIAAQYKGKIKVVRVDGDKNPVLCKKYGVTAYPTIVIVKPGQKAVSHVGYKSVKGLQNIVNKVINP